MIIPRTPSPEPEIPLVDRDPATLSVEETRQLIEELKVSFSQKYGGDELEIAVASQMWCR